MSNLLLVKKNKLTSLQREKRPENEKNAHRLYFSDMTKILISDFMQQNTKFPIMDFKIRVFDFLKSIIFLFLLYLKKFV